MGLDGVLMKQRMATLGNEAAPHERPRSENANPLQFDVKMFLEEGFCVSLGHYEVVVSFSRQILKKKGSSSFLQRLERCGPITVAVQLRVRNQHIDTN